MKIAMFFFTFSYYIFHILEFPGIIHLPKMSFTNPK